MTDKHIEVLKVEDGAELTEGLMLMSLIASHEKALPALLEVINEAYKKTGTTPDEQFKLLRIARSHVMEMALMLKRHEQRTADDRDDGAGI